MNLILSCTAVAILWTIGFVFGRKSGADTVTLAMLGCLATGLIGVPFAFFVNFGSLDRGIVGLGLSSGLFNGLGLAGLFIMFALASRQSWQLSHIVPIAYVLTIIFTTIAGRAFLAEALTTYKIISVLLLTAGTYFLVADH